MQEHISKAFSISKIPWTCI